MEQRVGPRRQRQTPGMAELEAVQQTPAETNAIEHLTEDVHGPDVSPADGRTQYSDD